MTEGLVELETIAELSLALTGFSALLAMFRGGSIHTWQPRPRLAFWLIITYGLGALAFSLLPSLLRDLGLHSWAAPMLALATFHLVAYGLFLRRSFSLTAAGDPTPNAASWVVGSVVTAISLIVLFWGATGGLGGPSYRLYHFGAVACLFNSANSFVGVLRLERPAA